jgi:hypothetical protein
MAKIFNFVALLGKKIVERSVLARVEMFFDDDADFRFSHSLVLSLDHRTVEPND